MSEATLPRHCRQDWRTPEARAADGAASAPEARATAGKTSARAVTTRSMSRRAPSGRGRSWFTRRRNAAAGSSFAVVSSSATNAGTMSRRGRRPDHDGSAGRITHYSAPPRARHANTHAHHIPDRHLSAAPDTSRSRPMRERHLSNRPRAALPSLPHSRQAKTFVHHERLKVRSGNNIRRPSTWWTEWPLWTDVPPGSATRRRPP